MVRVLENLIRGGLFPIVLVFAACDSVRVDVPTHKSKAPVEIKKKTDLATIKLDRIAVKVPRGKAIGEYRGFGFECALAPGNIFWNSGRIMGRNLEFSDLFYSVMADANFNVVGNPNQLFTEASGGKVPAIYRVGGQIEDIRLNICNKISFWTGQVNGLQTGKGAVTVRWQVYSTLEDKVVYETKTSGSVDTGQPTGDVANLLITQAFAEAAGNLASDEKLVAVLRNKKPSIADARDVVGTRLMIRPYSNYRKPITANIDKIRVGVVTISTGGGHGSGFFITPSLIMTNFHVVKQAEFVRIILLTGRKILGEVIRRHPDRDVALIQVEKGGHLPIPIRTDPVKITEDVYAIGSPLRKGYSGTVSKGIISKYHTNKRGLEDIQADVDIHGGNSGGVLVDGQGNTVGVSYAGVSAGGSQTSVGLNFFIPIMDALTKLNIRFEPLAEKS